MSSKVTYNVMKDFFNGKIEEMFLPLAKDLHGWEKAEFLEALYQEIHAEYEEETYDIALQAPIELQ